MSIPRKSFALKQQQQFPIIGIHGVFGMTAHVCWSIDSPDDLAAFDSFYMGVGLDFSFASAEITTGFDQHPPQLVGHPYAVHSLPLSHFNNKPRF